MSHNYHWQWHVQNIDQDRTSAKGTCVLCHLYQIGLQQIFDQIRMINKFSNKKLAGKEFYYQLVGLCCEACCGIHYATLLHDTINGPIWIRKFISTILLTYKFFFWPSSAQYIFLTHVVCQVSKLPSCFWFTSNVPGVSPKQSRVTDPRHWNWALESVPHTENDSPQQTKWILDPSASVREMASGYWDSYWVWLVTNEQIRTWNAGPSDWDHWSIGHTYMSLQK